ncbi:MAG: hypothetical protein GC191_16255 [Azospirillum sp.]|nr:hypothetical protein [Azospirillum sp.]
MAFDFILGAWAVLGSAIGSGPGTAEIAAARLTAQAPPAAVGQPASRSIAASTAKATAKVAAAPTLTTPTAPADSPRYPRQPISAGMAAASGGGWRIHLASYRIAGNADSGWAEFRAKEPSVIGGLQPFTTIVDLPGKGSFTRLFGGPFVDRAAAQAACDALHRDHLYCQVDRGG